MTVVTSLEVDPEVALGSKRAAKHPMYKTSGPKYFAIIGSRTPDKAQEEVAYHLAWAITVIGGHTLRTGAAYGIDQKAMEGARPNHLEVFLPWSSYNRSIIPAGASVVVYTPSIHRDWTASVASYHPNISALTHAAIALHARNFGIIHGCHGVVALPREDGGGGTAQGVRIANGLNIPVIQGNKGSITDVPRFIGKALQELGLADPTLRTTIQGR
jgi:hypothetical protein